MQKDILNWLYFDLDCYFASIEQQLNTNLQGKPIIVVPMQHDAASAIAVSYDARKYGVKTGTKVYNAKKLCPEIICIQARPKVYVHYHHLIFAEIDKHLLVDHVFSIDEGACRLTGTLQHEDNAIKIARTIQNSLKRTIGDIISCSIGIASNKFIAKIASNIIKPNGVTVIHHQDIQNTLSKLELKDLPGIGSSTERRLITQGVSSVSDLYEQKSPGDLERIFRSITGQRYFYLLRGVDLATQETKKASISQSKVLIEDEKTIQNARQVTMQLALKAAARLRYQNFTAGKVMLQINCPNKHTLKQSQKTPQASDSQTLSKALLHCFDSLLQNTKINIINKISLTLTNLEEPTNQLSLIDLSSQKKKSKVSKALDELNKKYGANAISIGLTNLKKDVHDPIAFGHIPGKKEL
ncbi:MAG: DNA-directed DNA polymerase [Pseudomonadota bacterium]